MTGITAFGAYLPRLRLARNSVVEANAWVAPELRSQGKGERTMCNWDEDTITMAVEAARDCLTQRDRTKLAAVHLASTTLPFADRQNAGIVAAALALDEHLATMDVGSSQRAGTTGLLAALSLAGNAGGDILFVASDSRNTRSGAVQELQYGDGAAALTLGNQQPIARLIGSHSVSVDFVDHYRASDRQFDYGWEERWIRDEGYARIVPEAVKGLFAQTGLKAEQFQHFILPCVMPKVADSLAKKLGFADGVVADTLHANCGETGTAHAIVMLVACLERAKPGERILVLGFGQGCDAIAFEVTAEIANLPPRAGVRGSLARRKEETNYNKYLSFNGLIERERGKRAELDNQTALTTLYRNRDMLLGLVGGVCTKCGTRQFPRSLVCVNPNCRARHSQEEFCFADIPASIMTFSADYLTYTADPPLHYGTVQFEGGGRFLANFTDVDVGNVKVGQPMRMMFRVKDYDNNRGFRRYFWKAAPAATQGA